MKTLPQGQNHRSAFSIIELLIVVAIIAAITGLAAPAFLSSQRGFALTRAGNELTDLANYARQLSLSRGTIASLIVTDSSFSQGAGAVVVGLDENGTWQPLSRWISLPESVVVDNNTQRPAAVSELNQFSDEPLQLKRGGDAITGSNARAIVFLPQGRIHDPSKTPTRRLRLSNVGATESTDNDYQILFRTDNGDVRVIRDEI